MLTVRQHDKLIDRITGLSEIELDQLMQDIAEHLRRNNLDHLLDVDNLQEEIDCLEDQLKEAEESKEDVDEKLFDITHLCYAALDIEEYEEDSFEKIVSIINQIQNIAR
jgi:flagellar motility protein MotE (MotC chaperone)